MTKRLKDPSFDLKTERVRVVLTAETMTAVRAHAAAEGWPLMEAFEYFLRFALAQHRS